MDRNTKARVEEAKRELDDILTSLADRHHRESAAPPHASIVFMGPIIIHRLVLDTHNREEVT